MDGERLVQNIRAIAIKKGIQMKDLYVMADITSGALSQWKSGKTKPHMSTLSRISAALTVTMQELLDGTETAPHAGDGEGRYGLREQDWWAIGHWFKHELDVMAHPPEYLANKSGIPLGRVEAFLAGNAELSKAELEALAKVIGKPLGEIIHGYATAFEKDDNPVDISVLLQRFGSLPPEQQKRLFHSVELLGEVGSDSSHLLELFESALENQKRTSQD